MRKTLRATSLLLALCCPAFGGDILTPPAAPTRCEETAEEPAAGRATPDGYIPNGVTDGLTRAALDVLALLPSLL